MTGDRPTTVLIPGASGDLTRRKLLPALFNLAHCFSPEIVVVGGGMSQAGALLLDPIRSMLTKCGAGCPTSGVKVVLATSGDAIMVFFGNPVPYEDHPQRAVRAAFEMRAKLAELWQRWGLEGDEVMNIGIGVTTGYVTVGNIGSQARIDYTVLGNHVNLASRLADRVEPGQILVS